MSELKIRNFATHIEPIDNISGQDRVNLDGDNDIIITEIDNKQASVNDLDKTLSSESDVKHIKHLESIDIKEENEISAIDKCNENDETEAMRRMGLPIGFATLRIL